MSEEKSFLKILGISLAGMSLAVTAIGYSASAVSQELGWNKEWLSRWSGEATFSDDSVPQFSLETVQPLHQSENHTFFFQGRLSHEGDDWTTNVGGGVRWIDPGKNVILGVNGFWDRNYDPDHERIGFGGEIIGRFATARANVYEATSGWITTNETALQRTEEKALDGWDAEVEVPLPMAPWVSLAGGYYNWDAISADDIEGFRGTVRADLTNFMRLEGGVAADNQDTSGFLKLRIALGAPTGTEYTAYDHLKGETYNYHGRDLSKHMLDRVERHNEIVVEQRVVNKVTGGISGAVVIGRGT